MPKGKGYRIRGVPVRFKSAKSRARFKARMGRPRKRRR